MLCGNRGVKYYSFDCFKLFINLDFCNLFCLCYCSIQTFILLSYCKLYVVYCIFSCSTNKSFAVVFCYDCIEYKCIIDVFFFSGTGTKHRSQQYQTHQTAYLLKTCLFTGSVIITFQPSLQYLCHDDRQSSIELDLRCFCSLLQSFFCCLTSHYYPAILCTNCNFFLELIMEMIMFLGVVISVAELLQVSLLILPQHLHENIICSTVSTLSQYIHLSSISFSVHFVYVL